MKKEFQSIQSTVKLSNGFTLMEMLVVVAVLSIFGIILTQIFVRSLTGSYKVQILSAIKQNGQAALEAMDKNVRGADAIICPTLTSPSADTLMIVKNGVYTRYRLVPPSPPVSPTINGYLAQDTPLVDPLNPDLNALCPETAIMSSPVIITDNQSSYTGNKIGVSLIGDPLGSGFRREAQAGVKDLVVISFQVVPGVQVPRALGSQIDPVRFTTTIELR